MPDNHAQLAKLAYVLLLLGVITGGITAVVAVVIAHLYAPQTDEPVRAHFRFQYRTFWIGLLYYVISGLTTLAMIGWLLLTITVVWWLVRGLRGLDTLNRDQPPSNLETWGF